MNCSVCSKEMIVEDFGQKVNVCENGCKGIWFDHFALQRLDQNNEGVGEALKAALNYPRVNDGNRGPIKCPKCNMPMHSHKYERSQEVCVDECYGCGGYFLDSGELAQIRNKSMSDAQVDAYVAKLAGDVQSDVHLQAAEKLGKILQMHYWNA